MAAVLGTLRSTPPSNSNRNSKSPWKYLKMGLLVKQQKYLKGQYGTAIPILNIAFCFSTHKRVTSSVQPLNSITGNLPASTCYKMLFFLNIITNIWM
jgi:hypothetical protein